MFLSLLSGKYFLLKTWGQIFKVYESLWKDTRQEINANIGYEYGIGKREKDADVRNTNLRLFKDILRIYMLDSRHSKEVNSDFTVSCQKAIQPQVVSWLVQ